MDKLGGVIAFILFFAIVGFLDKYGGVLLVSIIAISVVWWIIDLIVTANQNAKHEKYMIEQAALQAEESVRKEIARMRYNEEQEQLRQQQERNRKQFELQELLRKEEEEQERLWQIENARLLALERDREAWEEQLRRKVEEARALAMVRNEAEFDRLQRQLSLITYHKQQGANIDKEIMYMQESLKNSANEDNKQMIEFFLNSLSSLQLS